MTDWMAGSDSSQIEVAVWPMGIRNWAFSKLTSAASSDRLDTERGDAAGI